MKTRETGAGIRDRVDLALRLASLKTLTWQRGLTGFSGQRLTGLLRDLITDDSLAQAAEILRALF